MIEILFLGIGVLVFIVTIYTLIHIVLQFSQMRAQCMLMEAAFRDHVGEMNHIKEFSEENFKNMQVQYEGTKEDYEKVQDAYKIVQKEYKRLTESNNSLQERVNKYDKDRKKPMGPDITFN